MNLILASSSKYRKAQLDKLGFSFSCISPNIDESPMTGESAKELAIRLAKTKAKTVAKKQTRAIIIGSDQVAVIDQQIIGKPGSFTKAREQLQSFSGNTVYFYTALCVTDGKQELSALITTECKFINLNDTQIENYLNVDQPFDTAGSAKIEALGIALMEYVRSDDPSALIGLPLIALCSLLRKFGLDPLDPKHTF